MSTPIFPAVGPDGRIQDRHLPDRLSGTALDSQITTMEAARDTAVQSATKTEADATQTGLDRTAVAADRAHVDGQVEAIDTAFTESVPAYLQPDSPGGLNATYAPNARTFTPESFGAKADGTSNDAPAIQSAIDAAYNIGGGRVLTTPGKSYRIDSRIQIRRRVTLDMGHHADGGRLIMGGTYAGVNLEAGAHITGSIQASRSQYIGPALELSTTFTEATYGSGDRLASYNVAIRCGTQAGSTAVRLHSASGGLAWTRGVAHVIEADYPLVMAAETGGYVNENEIELVASDAVDYFVATVDGVGNSQVDGNRLNIVAQTGGRPRARRMIDCNGRDNIINLRTWDFGTSARWHPDYDGNFVYFGPHSGGNKLEGNIFFGDGMGVIDKRTGPRVNIIHVHDFRRLSPDMSLRSSMPSGYGNPVMNGSEDDVFAFAADGRYPVTFNGVPSAAGDSYRYMFHPAGLNASFTSATEMDIVIDMGWSIPSTDLSIIGVIFSTTPDYAELAASTNGTTWTTILSSTDPVGVFARQDTASIPSGRFFRLRFTNETPRNIAISRFFMGRKAGSYYDYGAWLPKYRPNVLDSIHINGQQVLGSRRAGFPAPSGVSAGGAFNADTATLEDLKKHYAALLSALRAMGIVGD